MDPRIRSRSAPAGLPPSLAVRLTAPAAAQTVPDHGGQRAWRPCDARNPAAALQDYQAALAIDSTSYEANWRASHRRGRHRASRPRTACPSPARDSLYAPGRKVRPPGRGGEPRRRGRLLRPGRRHRAGLAHQGQEGAGAARRRDPDEALRAIELNPRHDGAYHILGRWNAEIMRLSGFERFFAKSFLGGAVFNQASWDKAVAYMQQGDRDPPGVHLSPARPGADLHRHQAVGPGPAAAAS